MQIKTNILAAYLKVFLRPVAALVGGAMRGTWQESSRERRPTNGVINFILSDIRQYFAPLTGAFRGTRQEMRRIEVRVHRHHRDWRD